MTKDEVMSYFQDAESRVALATIERWTPRQRNRLRRLLVALLREESEGRASALAASAEPTQ